MRYKILLLLWLVTDICVFISAYALAYFARVGFIFSSDFPFDLYIKSALITAPLWLIVLITTRTFALTRKQRTLRNFAYIIYCGLVGVSLFTLLYYFQYNAFFSRLLLVAAFIFSSGLVWIWHIIFEYILRHQLYTNTQFPTVIVGVTRESRLLIERLNAEKNPIKPVAILDGRGCKDKNIDGVPVRGKLNKLEEVLQEGITHLIQCSDLEQSLNLLSACRQKKITYMLLPSVLGMVERDEKIETLEGQPVTMVSPKENPLMWFFR